MIRGSTEWNAVLAEIIEYASDDPGYVKSRITENYGIPFDGSSARGNSISQAIGGLDEAELVGLLNHLRWRRTQAVTTGVEERKLPVPATTPDTLAQSPIGPSTPSANKKRHQASLGLYSLSRDLLVRIAGILQDDARFCTIWLKWKNGSVTALNEAQDIQMLIGRVEQLDQIASIETQSSYPDGSIILGLVYPAEQTFDSSADDENSQAQERVYRIRNVAASVQAPRVDHWISTRKRAWTTTQALSIVAGVVLVTPWILGFFYTGLPKLSLIAQVAGALLLIYSFIRIRQLGRQPRPRDGAAVILDYNQHQTSTRPDRWNRVDVIATVTGTVVAIATLIIMLIQWKGAR